MNEHEASQLSGRLFAMEVLLRSLLASQFRQEDPKKKGEAIFADFERNRAGMTPEEYTKGRSVLDRVTTQALADSVAL